MNLEATAKQLQALFEQTNKPVKGNWIAPELADIVKILREASTPQERIANALEAVLDKEKGCLRMVDVDRANVYKTHLGKKLSDEK